MENSTVDPFAEALNDIYQEYVESDNKTFEDFKKAVNRRYEELLYFYEDNSED